MSEGHLFQSSIAQVPSDLTMTDVHHHYFGFKGTSDEAQQDSRSDATFEAKQRESKITKEDADNKYTSSNRHSVVPISSYLRAQQVDYTVPTSSYLRTSKSDSAVPISSYLRASQSDSAVPISSYLRTSQSDSAVPISSYLRTATDSSPVPTFHSFAGSNLDERCGFYAKHRKFWNDGESLLSLFTGAWAAKKYGIIVYAKDRQIFELRNVISTSHRNGIANAFACTVGAVAGSYALDSLVWDRDQKMETTLATDCVINPMISLSRMPIPTKIGWMIAAHLGARLFDHFRQPQRDLLCPTHNQAPSCSKLGI